MFGVIRCRKIKIPVVRNLTSRRNMVIVRLVDKVWENQRSPADAVV